MLSLLHKVYPILPTLLGRQLGMSRFFWGHVLVFLATVSQRALCVNEGGTAERIITAAIHHVSLQRDT